jgi:hypothetical protein
MYKAAILLNVSGFPKHGEIKCPVPVPRFCPANGGNGIIEAKPLGSILSVCVILQGIPKLSCHCQGNPSTLTFMNSEAYE